jgi:hypothetical protein
VNKIGNDNNCEIIRRIILIQMGVRKPNVSKVNGYVIDEGKEKSQSVRIYIFPDGY